MTLAALLRRSVVQTWYLLVAASLVLGGFQLLTVAAATALTETSSFALIAQYVPSFLQRGIGSDALLIASFKGTVAFGYFHPVIVIMLTVLASYYAAEPAFDVESGLVDVVLARPVPRHRLLTRSVVLALGAPVTVVSAMALGTWTGLSWFAPAGAERPTAAALLRLMVTLVAVAWCLGALALAVASRSRRWSAAFGAAVLGSVLLYLVDFLAIGWPMWRRVSWLSPFHYYPALTLLSGAEPVLPNVAVLLGAATVCISLAYWEFSRRDL